MFRPSTWTLTRSVTLGLLVAAAGIGGSDVSMAALTGSRFGLMLLWAIVAGAFIKFVLNEGVARWQVATGETFLQGVCHRLGPVARIVFLVYLLPWTFAVGASVMSACAGVAAAALTGEQGWAATSASDSSGLMRVLLGLGHSLAAAALVLSGGYAVFKRVMGVLTIAMVLLVVVAAVLTRPDLSAVADAIFVPRLPLDDPEGVQWTIALFGGIGGTVTMLAYGYWTNQERDSTLTSRLVLPDRPRHRLHRHGGLRHCADDRVRGCSGSPERVEPVPGRSVALGRDYRACGRVGLPCGRVVRRLRLHARGLAVHPVALRGFHFHRASWADCRGDRLSSGATRAEG